MNKAENTKQYIERYFQVPARVQGQIKNIVEEIRGGYVLIETRPPWNGSNANWSRSAIAKIIFHKPTQTWKLYWKRASGKWNLYNSYRTLHATLKSIKEDKHGCFWG